ncbi:uncharacterized protein LOC142230731 [Haematobia irritans]|uniref:uncharacterized protein LOC142230731 n=1 Tax=Haematobia irritans TaxID=7368 RepID=UPI003F5029F2
MGNEEKLGFNKKKEKWSDSDHSDISENDISILSDNEIDLLSEFITNTQPENNETSDSESSLRTDDDNISIMSDNDIDLLAEFIKTHANDLGKELKCSVYGSDQVNTRDKSGERKVVKPGTKDHRILTPEEKRFRRYIYYLKRIWYFNQLDPEKLDKDDLRFKRRMSNFIISYESKADKDSLKNVLVFVLNESKDGAQKIALRRDEIHVEAQRKLSKSARQRQRFYNKDLPEMPRKPSNQVVIVSVPQQCIPKIQDTANCHKFEMQGNSSKSNTPSLCQKRTYKNAYITLKKLNSFNSKELNCTQSKSKRWACKIINQFEAQFGKLGGEDTSSPIEMKTNGTYEKDLSAINYEDFEINSNDELVEREECISPIKLNESMDVITPNGDTEESDGNDDDETCEMNTLQSKTSAKKKRRNRKNSNDELVEREEECISPIKLNESMKVITPNGDADESDGNDDDKTCEMNALHSKTSAKKKRRNKKNRKKKNRRRKSKKKTTSNVHINVKQNRQAFLEIENKINFADEGTTQAKGNDQQMVPKVTEQISSEIRNKLHTMEDFRKVSETGISETPYTNNGADMVNLLNYEELVESGDLPSKTIGNIHDNAISFKKQSIGKDNMSKGVEIRKENTSFDPKINYSDYIETLEKNGTGISETPYIINGSDIVNLLEYDELEVSANLPSNTIGYTHDNSITFKKQSSCKDNMSNGEEIRKENTSFDPQINYSDYIEILEKNELTQQTNEMKVIATIPEWVYDDYSQISIETYHQAIKKLQKFDQRNPNTSELCYGEKRIRDSILFKIFIYQAKCCAANEEARAEVLNKIENLDLVPHILQPYQKNQVDRFKRYIKCLAYIWKANEIEWTGDPVHFNRHSDFCDYIIAYEQDNPKALNTVITIPLRVNGDGNNHVGQLHFKTINRMEVIVTKINNQSSIKTKLKKDGKCLGDSRNSNANRNREDFPKLISSLPPQNQLQSLICGIKANEDTLPSLPYQTPSVGYIDKSKSDGLNLVSEEIVDKVKTVECKRSNSTSLDDDGMPISKIPKCQ